MNDPSTEKFALELVGVAKRFGKKPVVRDLSFRIRKGEIYGLIGPDGAGKTTTLRMIAGALLPDEGEIFIEEIQTRKDPDGVREKLGYMPQAYGLYEDLTVQENLEFYGELQNVERSRLKSRIGELLGFVKLDRFYKRKAGDLSGGMYKKLAIACSIVHSPGLLILDEPTNGVDPVSRRDLWALLFRLAEEGVSMIVSTPYMDEAQRCNVSGLMFDGTIVRTGSPASLLAEMEGRLFYIEDSSRELRTILDRERKDGRLPELHALYRSGAGMRFVASRESCKHSGFQKKLQKIVRESSRTKSTVVSVHPGFEDLFMEIQQTRNQDASTPGGPS